MSARFTVADSGHGPLRFDDHQAQSPEEDDVALITLAPAVGLPAAALAIDIYLHSRAGSRPVLFHSAALRTPHT
jgi:hypothetical protein